MAKKVVGKLDGATLRRFREKHGVSGAEVSLRIGKNRGWSQKVESEAPGATLLEPVARALCSAYDESPEFFGLDPSVGPRVFNVGLVARHLKKMGKSWRQLADLVGVASQTVYRWKNEGATPSDESITLLAETLSVSEEDLWTYEDAVEVAAQASGVFVEFTESEWRGIAPVVRKLLGRTPRVNRGV